MARAWVYDRTKDKAFNEAVKAAKEAKRTPPARWMVRYYDPAGRLKSGGTFQRKPDAERRKSELEGELNAGSFRDPSEGRATVGELAERWLKAQHHLKRSTRRDYREYLDNYVLPEWGDVAVNKVRFEAVSDWVNRLVHEPGKRGGTLSASYVRKVFYTLSHVLGWAVKSRRILVSPAREVPLPKIAPSRHVYLDPVQVERLASCSGEYRVLILLLAYTGLRWGEVSAIRVGRVDLARHRIHIEETYGRESGTLYLDTPKNHEQRAVPIPGFLLEELRSLCEGRDADELAFTAPQGGPLHYDNFRRRVFNPAVKDAGLAELEVTAHKLRHTAASLAIASGADVKVVQMMLGHKTATMTLDTYGHLFPDRLDEVARKMGERRDAALRESGDSNGEPGRAA
ncbi:tyrosine-type recombinase/integrase [Nocardiopsis lambiniae]|uniref:Tyrosine-type recombinase/integrase n=1 Tax=Nocardiopsis lambiniae TaxID=3075539 RepID=A0ABU2MFJ6_9ACTN|nr:tyrosine-type recombinase/integrase [Nocardiopsis sp. DSM 44743]MDT0331031.1 tyrosine-type recombinase/integrase [Nocardiopsis sp. DSM 44743]